MTTLIATNAYADEPRLSSIALALTDAAVVRFDPHGLSPAVTVAQAMTYFTAVYTSQNPTLVIVIGDGPEMLAAGLAALFMKVPVSHLSGDANDEFDGPLRECLGHISEKCWYE